MDEYNFSDNFYVAPYKYFAEANEIMLELSFIYMLINIGCAPGLSKSRVVKHENIESFNDISHIQIDCKTDILRGTMVRVKKIILW